MTVTGQYQYPDDHPGDEDAFAREPFIVRFKAPKTGELTDLKKYDLRSEKHLEVPPKHMNLSSHLYIQL